MSRRTRALTAGALAAVTGGALLSLTPAYAGGAPPATAPVPARDAAPADAATNDETHTVTLVTGDVVTLTERADGPASASVERASGAAGGYRIQQASDDTYVIPDSALPYLASGELDPDLFNVTGLIEQGYDDASIDEIPLIVQYDQRSRSARHGPPEHATTTRPLPSIRGAAMTADKAQAAGFWDSVAPVAAAAETAAPATSTGLSHGISRIHLDGRVETSLADSVAQVGAPQAWADGLDGSGVTVAVLDTGIDADHPDLADQIADMQSFVPGEPMTDVAGHGTHVASTIAGTGAASDGLEKGVAPGADLVVGKVLADDGFGQASWIIAGMEWGAAHADVVNMSLGSYEPSDGTDPMAMALDQISADTGALFVVAAGNYGRVSGIGSPGAAPSALTVGAVDSFDQRAWFQDMGPILDVGTVKPEIVAPGVGILAARSSDSPGAGSYTTMDGTSMATPHVAGAAAIVKQQHPDWTGQQVKDALASTALPLEGETAYRVGDGRLDVPAALGEVTATSTVSFGQFRYPHGDDDPVERTVTYRNSGEVDITLDLALDTTGQDGADAPEALVALSASTVEVPAGSEATVTLTADPNLGASGTTYSGYLTATQAGERVTQTGYGLVKEQEMYTLDVSALGRDGGPTGGYVTIYLHGDDRITVLALDPETGTLPPQRFVPGDYDVSAWLPVEGGDGSDSLGLAWVGTPNLILDQDREVVLDTRLANPINLKTPKPTDTGVGIFGYFYGDFANQYIVNPNIDSLYAEAVPEQDVDPTYHWVSWWHQTAPLLQLAAPGKGGGDLDEVYQQGSIRYEGKERLPLVEAGHGTPEDLSGLDLAGTAVLVTRDEGVDPAVRAQAAFDAGAALLVVANDGPGRPYEFAGGTDLPVVGISPVVADRLRGQLATGRPVLLHATGSQFPPYLMDLTRDHQGGLPEDLSYAPSLKELARIDQEFVGTDQDLVFSDRALCRGWFWPPCLEMYEPVQTEGTRTDYVTADVPAGDLSGWYEQIIDPAGWEVRDTMRTYDRGETTTRRWFEPVTRPVVGEGYWHPRRAGDWFMVNVPMAGSGDQGMTGHYDYEAAHNVNRLYQDGVLVREMEGFHSIQEAVPMTDGWAEYVFEQETSHDQRWAYSTQSTSRWTFQAKTDEPETFQELPLVQLDYSVDTDLRGRATSTKPTLTLSAHQLDGAQGAGVIDGATLEVSYDDGASWSTVSLTPASDGAWTAQLEPGKGASHVSLRATAWDDAGNTVEQEVIRAFGTR